MNKVIKDIAYKQIGFLAKQLPPRFVIWHIVPVDKSSISP